MLATSVTLAAVLLASPLVDVRSSTNCPSSQNVAKRLRPLLPYPATPGSFPDVATIEAAGTGAAARLRVRLVHANGSEVGDRWVLAQGNCAEVAATLAAVIAVWESEPLPAITPADQVVAAAPARVASTTPSVWRVLIGAGGGVALVGSVAGAGGIEALAGKSDSRLYGRIGFTAETTRATSLSDGNVDWQHTTFEAGVLLRTLHPAWPMSIDAGLALGWATLEGRGFTPGRQHRAFEYGAVAAARLGRNLGRWCVWAEARAFGWARGQRAVLSGDTTAGMNLPLVDVTVSIGLSAPLIW
jgi:hypothetical protein